MNDLITFAIAMPFSFAIVAFLAHRNGKKSGLSIGKELAEKEFKATYVFYRRKGK